MRPHGGSRRRNTNREALCFADGIEASPVCSWRRGMSCAVGSPCFPGLFPSISTSPPSPRSSRFQQPLHRHGPPWISARVSLPVTHSGSSQPCSPKVTSRQSPVAPRGELCLRAALRAPPLIFPRWLPALPLAPGAGTSRSPHALTASCPRAFAQRGMTVLCLGPLLVQFYLPHGAPQPDVIM